MPAKNQYWKQIDELHKNAGGRPYKFDNPQQLWKLCQDYFNYIDGHPLFRVEQLKKPYLENGKWVTIEKVSLMRPYTLQGLYTWLNVNKLYFNEFEESLKGKDDDFSVEFSVIITRVRNIIFQQKFEGAAAGLLNANIIAREIGLADKVENRNVDKDGNDISAATIHVTTVTKAPDISETED